MSLLLLCSFFFLIHGDHLDLHVLTHSFPTRRSSDLLVGLLLGTELVGGVDADSADGSDGDRDADLLPQRHRVIDEAPQGASADQHHRADEADVLDRSEEHTSELQSLMRISYAVYGLKKKI